MDHLALRAARTTTATFQPAMGRMNQQRLRVPTATVSCRGSTDFYRLLSISSPKNVGREEIKRAYRSMALRYHPDLCRDDSMKEESTRMFVQLNEAYRTLSDPVLKNEYDFELGLDGLGCDDFQTSCTEKDRFDLERQFERNQWQDQQGSDTRNVQEDASELKRRNTMKSQRTRTPLKLIYVMTENSFP